MNTHHHRGHQPGFTLIEAVISVAILGFALTVIIGTLGYAARLSAENQHKGLAIDLVNDCFADLANGTRNELDRSRLYDLQVPAKDRQPGTQQLWFDIDGQTVKDESKAFFRCDLIIRPDPNPALVHLCGHVRWPARAPEGKSDGETELLTSLVLP